RRRRGAVRGEARGQESRLRPRGRRRHHPQRPLRSLSGVAALPSARRVLIVDDERDIRTTLHAVFGSAGYECRTAPNAREAARLFEGERSPLTITDLKMPGMDGMQLLQPLRARDADAAVIMLTGAGDLNTAVESLKQGASDFILKPVNPDQVLLAAERALERRQLILERREHQALLETRVAEATRDLAAASAGSRRPTRPRWRRSAPRSPPARWAPSCTRAASTLTPPPWPALTGWLRRRSTRSAAACCCTTSARSASPTASCSSPVRSLPKRGQSCPRTRRWGARSSRASRSSATRSRSCTTTTSAGTAPATRSGWPARRSRSERASSRWPTPSTR